MLVGAALLVAALVVPAALIIGGEARRQAEVSAAAEEPVPGAVEETDLSAAHVTAPIESGALPPMGGDHHPVWQDCGFYTEPVRNEHAVHSLEHGAVWVTYRPDLPENQVAILRSLADRHAYLLVSPYEGLASPLVATAWGVQVELESAEDDRLEVFLERYLQGPQTPEPGAACTGGIGGA